MQEVNPIKTIDSNMLPGLDYSDTETIERRKQKFIRFVGDNNLREKINEDPELGEFLLDIFGKYPSPVSSLNFFVRMAENTQNDLTNVEAEQTLIEDFWQLAKDQEVKRHALEAFIAILSQYLTQESLSDGSTIQLDESVRGISIFFDEAMVQRMLMHITNDSTDAFNYSTIFSRKLGPFALGRFVRRTKEIRVHPEGVINERIKNLLTGKFHKPHSMHAADLGITIIHEIQHAADDANQQLEILLKQRDVLFWFFYIAGMSIMHSLNGTLKPENLAQLSDPYKLSGLIIDFLFIISNSLILSRQLSSIEARANEFSKNNTSWQNMFFAVVASESGQSPTFLNPTFP